MHVRGVARLSEWRARGVEGGLRARLIEWLEPSVGEAWAQVLIPDQPALSALGGAVAVAVAALWGRREGLSWWRVALSGGAAALGAVVFSRVLWVVIEWERFVADPVLLVHPFRGGQVSFGALAGAGLGAALALWWLKLPVRRAADVMAPPGLFGIALARVGCLMRGCDFGTPSALPWSVRYPEGSTVYRLHLRHDLIEPGALLSAPVHPFPLYLAAWVVFCGALAMAAPRLFGERPGQRAVGTGLLYLAGRFCLEFFRQPGNAPMVWGALNMGHVMALVWGAVLVVLFAWVSRVKPAAG
jgi:prolipoprotein diacylglyceryltransferase